MMKLGYASAILPDLSLEEVVEFTAANGFATVELMCWPAGKAERRYAGVTHIDVVGFTQADADKVNALVDAAGITISALGYYPNPLVHRRRRVPDLHRPHQTGDRGRRPARRRRHEQLHRPRLDQICR